jgi:hypothetical protein
MKIKPTVSIAILFIFLMACGNSTKKRLVGSWLVKSVDFSALVAAAPEEQKAYLESLIPRMEATKKATKTVFQEDNHFRMKTELLGESMVVSGTYKLIDNQQKIVLQYGDNKQDTIQIIRLNDKTMEVKMDAQETGVKIVWEKIKQSINYN